MDIKSLLKASGNEYATIVGKDGIMTDADTAPYDTGSYTLNALLSGSIYGGLPSNKITAFAGEQGVGKTFFALSAAKLFLDNHPSGIVVYIDTEAATTAEMLAQRVGHLDRILVLPIVTVQEFSTQTSKLLSQYAEMKKKDEDARMLLILDSMGNLSTSKEVADIEEGNETKDMTRAQLIKGAFRALTLKLAKNHVPLLFTNHTYQGMGMYATKTMSGGGGPLFNASQIIFLTKSKIAEGTEKIGNVINMTTFKGRITKEGSKASTRVFFDRGLDRYYGLLDLVKKYEIWPMESKQFVINGTKVWAKTIEEHPEKYFTDEVLQKIDEAARQEYLYGSAIDEADEYYNDTEDDSE